MLRHPRWPWDVILRPALRRRMPSYGHYPPEVHAGLLSPAMAEELRLDPALTRQDFRALCLKGGLSAEGAAAIVVSTHGGRSFDGLPTTVEALPSIAADPGAVPELLADSGVRRGSGVLKHRAFGASAVQLGRAPLRDLAAGGKAGVGALPAMAEMRAAMGFLGVRTLADLSAKAEAGQPRAQKREHADMIPGGPAGAVRKWNVPQEGHRSPSLHRGHRDRAQPWAVRTASMLDSARRGPAFMTWPGSSLPRIRSAVRADSMSLPRSIPVGKPDSSHR
ncbi:hypothetical protein DVR11_06625 [Paracoccus versutus]|nr:hypothetical protein DVR11_06625 [Paracoccus versutus]